MSIGTRSSSGSHYPTQCPDYVQTIGTRLAGSASTVRLVGVRYRGIGVRDGIQRKSSEPGVLHGLFATGLLQAHRLMLRAMMSLDSSCSEPTAFAYARTPASILVELQCSSAAFARGYGCATPGAGRSSVNSPDEQHITASVHRRHIAHTWHWQLATPYRALPSPRVRCKY